MTSYNVRLVLIVPAENSGCFELREERTVENCTAEGLAVEREGTHGGRCVLGGEA